MEIEIGIRNVARALNFNVDATADDISKTIDDAVAGNKPIDLTDSRGRRIVIPTDALGYVVIGSDIAHPVGFGAL
ncbi:DUF3107 domain-containing protein [Bifidobacterium aquikefiricola]|uniref:DUF3107 domain-containing protein n=1 Tax=Bifidobacterium aquikefiricola TaxID=3059038 RepID=A0AB39U4Y7_9BIFI